MMNRTRSEMPMSNRFVFPKTFGDARVEELKILSVAAQIGDAGLHVSPVPKEPWQGLLSLVSDGLLTAFSYETRKKAVSTSRNPNPNWVIGAGIAGETE